MKFIVDNEIYLSEQDDILETKRYAEALKDTILNAPTPFNIGLYGEWGSGKSSIIKTVQTQLESNKDEKIKFIIYDAWKYSNDSFRRMFLKTLQEQLKFDGTDLFESFYRNKTQDTEINPTLNMKSLGITVVLLILTFTMISSLQLETKWELTLQSIVAFGSMIIAFYKNIFTDYKVTIQKPIMFAPEQFEDAFKDMMAKSLEKYNIFSLATEYVKGNHYDKNIDKLVIVVDNIDRCDKKTAYELLTNIKNFIGKKEGIVFLVPVDDEALKRHMQEHNKENSKEADEFLRKFFNTTIKIKHFQPRDLFEFANSLNTKHELGFKPDTINIVAKEYASNPRRIIQLFNNLTAELKTAEARHGYEFIEKNQSLIVKLLIIREEWADIFKSITEHPHKFINFNQTSVLDKKPAFENETFNLFMNRTKAITADVKTIEKIVLNITNESTLPNEIIKLAENNNFDEIKNELDKNNISFDGVVKYAIEELRKGVNRETFSTDARNALVLLSNLNEYKAIDKASLNELSGFYNRQDFILHTVEHLQKDDLNSFFKLIEYNQLNGHDYLQVEITKKFKEIWKEKPKDTLVSIYEDGLEVFINNSTDEKAIEEFQSAFVNYYDYFSNSPLYKEEWIDKNKLHLIVSKEFFDYLINKIVSPVVDPKSNEYLELEYFAQNKLLKIENIETFIEKIKPDFSQQITVSTNIQEEQQKRINDMFINIKAITSLLEKLKHEKIKSDIIIGFIQEFLKPVQIIQQSNRQQLTLNLISDIAKNIDYQQDLLKFYLEIYRITYNNTDVTSYIQSLLGQYPSLKNYFYNKLIELRNSHQLGLMPLFEYLVSQAEENESLFNLYEKLFNREELKQNNIEKIRNKLDVYIVKLLNSSNELVENFINRLMLHTKTKEWLTDIIISKESHDIIKLPQNIKKVAYINLCSADKIFELENNIEALKDILMSSDDFNGCILKIIKSKLLKSSGVGDALILIDEMQNINEDIKKEILAELKSHKNHEFLVDKVKETIKKLSPIRAVKK